MNQGEYLKLLLELVSKNYYSYIIRTDCKILYIKEGQLNRSSEINKIEEKIFIGLLGYFTDTLSKIPDGFFICQDKFTNGAMLVEHLPTSSN